MSCALGWGGERISADVIWGKKYERGKEKKEENVKNEEKRGKIKRTLKLKG
jgi:hypothetical protein